MNLFVLFTSLFTLSGSLATGYEVHTYEVYNENFENKYELKVTPLFSELKNKEEMTTVETFPTYANPYLKDKFDYNVYVEGDYNGYKFLGVKNDTLYDLETMEEIIITPQQIGNINDAIVEVSFDEIPENAKRAKYAYYFKNLSTSGYGRNSGSTCGIIAAQILFDYYDATANENVIESDYDNVVQENKNNCSSFENSPASIGSTFYRYLVNLYNDKYNCDVENSIGIVNTDEFHFIDSYIGATRNIDYTASACEGNRNDIFSGYQFDVALGAINQGRPVLISTLLHFMVAFAYDSTYLYVMTGWTNPIIGKIELDSYNGNIFSNYPGAYDLQLNHHCTESYYSTTLGKYICPCAEDKK